MNIKAISAEVLASIEAEVSRRKAQFVEEAAQDFLDGVSAQYSSGNRNKLLNELRNQVEGKFSDKVNTELQKLVRSLVKNYLTKSNIRHMVENEVRWAINKLAQEEFKKAMSGFSIEFQKNGKAI